MTTNDVEIWYDADKDIVIDKKLQQFNFFTSTEIN